jgi:hypothetical protein
VLGPESAAGFERGFALLTTIRVPERKSFLLRVDPKVYEALERWAADELRSVNAQIEFLLRRGLIESGRLRPKEK